MKMKAVSSLVDLCVQSAIDNIRYLGDVGDTDTMFLKRILPHCTVDQLMHIENSSKGRDLSLVTDKLWKFFYQRQFGIENTNIVIKRMEDKRINFKWKQLYEAKLKEREEACNKSMNRMKQRYAEAGVKKQSRQIQICSKIPPSTNKRQCFGGSGSCDVSNYKSNLMKKARVEYLKSNEVRMHAAMKKNSLQQKRSYTCMPQATKSRNLPGRSSASTSNSIKPLERRR